MAYLIDQFSSDCRDILAKDSSAAGLEKVRQNLEKALSDPDFVAAYLGPNNNEPRKILYEDPEMGFCIVAHVYDGAKGGHPHDHGPQWAIYGQAIGTTEMTEWKVVKKGQNGEASLVEPEITYDLKPGMARVYDINVVHSPDRKDSTKLIRIEGKNLDHVERNPYKASESAA